MHLQPLLLSFEITTVLRWVLHIDTYMSSAKTIIKTFAPLESLNHRLINTFISKHEVLQQRVQTFLYKDLVASKYNLVPRLSRLNNIMVYSITFNPCSTHDFISRLYFYSKTGISFGTHSCFVTFLFFLYDQILSSPHPTAPPSTPTQSSKK